MIRTFVISALAAIAVALVAAGATAARAQTPTPAQQPVVTIGINGDTSGDTATAVGTVTACKQIHVGDTLQVDVFIKGVPAESQPTGGLAGFGYNLHFDPKIIEITAVDDHYLLTSAGESSIFEVINADATQPGENPLPAKTGNMRVDFADLSQNRESGDGVLSRLTVKALSAGTSNLQLADPLILANVPIGANYDVIAQAGLVAVDSPCSAPPTPTTFSGQAAPNATPAPSSGSPGASAAASSGQPSGSAAPASGAGQPGGTTTVDSSGGSSSGTWIAIGIIAAAAVAALALGRWLLRRRKSAA